MLLASMGFDAPLTADDSNGASEWAQPEYLLEQIKKLQLQYHIPAIALVLMDNKRLLLSKIFALPASGKKTTTKINTSSPFRLGSISKTFTALCLLKLVDAGKVSLQDDLASLLPANSFQNRWHSDAPMKVIHLLEHTSGLSDLSVIEFKYNKALSLQQALALNPQNRETHWPPGTRHSYSNVNPGLTSLLIKEITGKSFEAVAAELLNELNMPSASFLPPEQKNTLPGGFKADGFTPIPYWHMTFRAFGALHASALQMGYFLEFLLNEGQTAFGKRLLSPSSFAQLFRPHSSLAAKVGLEVGYGAGLYSWVHKGQLLYGHGGDADGYRSRYAILRSADGEATPTFKRGYFVVINTDNRRAMREIRRLIEDAITDDIHTTSTQGTPSQAPTITVSRKYLQQYTGHYYPSTARFGPLDWAAGKRTFAEIKIQGDHLIFSRKGKSQSLWPISPQLFRRKNDPQATVAFIRDRHGQLYLQGELGEFVQQSLSQ